MEVISTNQQILTSLTDDDFKKFESESNDDKSHQNTINFLKLVSFKNNHLKKMLNPENEHDDEDNFKISKIEDVIDDLQNEISTKLKVMNKESDNHL
jgi:hypothetical protein